MSVALLVALLGHGFLWVAAVNRIHASRWSRRTIRLSTLFCFAMLGGVPIAMAWWMLTNEQSLGEAICAWQSNAAGSRAVLAYLGVCWLGAAVVVPRWLRRYVFRRRPLVLRSERFDRHRFDTGPAAAFPFGWLARMPGNQSLDLEVTHREIGLPRLPAKLHGLSIVHLSDLHFTGRIDKAYFREVVRVANDLVPDVTVVTGDMVDSTACIDWIPETLGRLKARHGVYFILGNHEQQVDSRQLIEVLERHGAVYVGGRYLETTLRGVKVTFAGNESPWFPPPAADHSKWPVGPALRIALLHSPDQFAWAQAWDAPLALAGHTHGGQIRIPGLGPIFAPCRHGVRYASGVYWESSTVLHVTRGISAELPLRFFCRPEIARLVLYPASRHG